MAAKPHLYATVACNICGCAFRTDCGEGVCPRCEATGPRCADCTSLLVGREVDDGYCGGCVHDHRCDCCGTIRETRLRLNDSGVRYCTDCQAEVA